MADRPVRVLMFGWEFPPHISGGLGTACYGLTTGLMLEGVDVTFVVPRVFGGEDRARFHLVDASAVDVDIAGAAAQERLARLKYIEINSPLIPYVSPAAYRAAVREPRGAAVVEDTAAPLQFAFSGGYGADLMLEVSRYALVAGAIAEAGAYDVVHAHDWLTYPAGIVARDVHGTPLVVHVHATEFDRSGERVNQAVYDVERRGFEAADAIIAVSEYTRRIVIERYGIAPEKVSVVYNGLLTRETPAPPRATNGGGEKIVTFLGRVTFQKGPEYFLEAARRVLERFPNTHFVMAGSGDMLRRMITLAASMRISSRVHFTGFLRGEETDRLFAMSDVYVMPSVSEPFGLAALEAIRSGVPVVISKQAGVAEVLKNAVKVDFWDVDALAGAIAELLQYRALTTTYVRESRRDIEELTWDNAARQVCAVYARLASKNQ